MFESLSHLCGGLFFRGNSGYGGIITMIIGLLVIVLVMYFVFRKNTLSGANSQGSYESAENILKRRFVTGEIDQADYSEKMEILRKS